MRIRDTFLVGCALGALSVLICTPAWAQSAGTAPAGASAQVDTSRDIVVTAQKRAQNLQSVPEAIQVLSGDQLVKEGVTSINDFADKVPGLVIVGGGDPGIGKAVIRGISTGSDRGGVVGVYVDDVAVSSVSPLALATGFVFDPDLSDIERVEVLKGPQSTLYGASAVGGVLHFVTKRPSLTTTSALLRLDGSSTEDGGQGYGVRAYINTPIVADKIGLSVSAFYRRTPGYTDNVRTGRDDVNYGISGGARAALRVALSDRVETTFSGIYQNIDVADQTLINLNAQGQPTYGETKFSRAFPLPISIRYRLASNTTTVDLDFATATNIVAYTDQTNNTSSDLSSLAGLAPGATYVSYANLNHTRRFTEELRLASRPGKLEWLLAGYYLHERNRNLVDIRGLDASGQLLPSSSPGYNVYSYNIAASYAEKAVFGNLTYHFTSKFEATVGARYSSINQDFSLVRSGILGTTPLANKGSDSSVTYLATASYTPISSLTLFARAASAYRPGTTQQLDSSALALGINPVYKADVLWNYELGAKGNLAGGRFTYEASLFYMDWKDIQFAATINNFSVIQNAGKANVKGAEVALGYRPFTGLSTSLRASYTDARLRVDLPSVRAHDGDTLPNSTKWNVAASADYRFVTSGSVTPTIGASYTYRSSAPSGFSNGVRFTLPSYSTLDLRAGLEWKNFAVDVRIDNVTNEYGLTSGAFASGGVPLRPRTYGIGLEVHY
ncbi:MAG: TonB-dependent receptor [Bradyrhizobium sp.]|nr:TonB-dependent receptor [Bradyrhizobium sp.]